MQGFMSITLCRWLLCFLPLLVIHVNANTCQWTEKANTYASGNDEDKPGITNADDCKEACGSGCCHVTFTAEAGITNPCKIFPSPPSYTETDSFIYDEVLYTKDECSCPSEATTTTTTTSSGCTMADVNNVAISSEPSRSVGMSVDSCKTLCKSLSQCQAITFGSSTCTVHTATTTSTAGSSVFARKTSCSDGGDCCFSALEENKSGTSSSSTSVTATSQSCKELCLAITTCNAASFSGSTCNLFFYSPSTGSGSSTYYTKTCAGSSTSTLSTTDACNSVEIIQLSKLLSGIWLIVTYTALA